MEDKEYTELLHNAFSKLPNLEEEHQDFVIPKVDSMIQGNKTIIKNINAIADRARRKREEISRYFEKELGVPTSLEDQRLVITGKFREEDLNKKLERYFNVYVICRECHKPDTHLENAGNGMYYLVCEACGARYSLKSY
ncbi:translation initiation factor aIF2 subunit beta [Candidatus Mancarchaeum acidiphilum]|uniref:Translation initiation factor aIF2 subunit beta n=1 Tax=Candidatus Mancarchaeum acidiphilum TaxID=1920749 RepID=A0A218NLP7_9ARCH|nr:translation initiation factor IF-2 subunit beta [Candidatus Mancarchaeum acidiphilum]ASI13386.1 translation initiation factor aIF2 subunit beta [Candidatus Mancarchaeum acidiphilum]